MTAILITISILAADRPNVLWITCEDTSPHLGCYGDKVARTPNLDRFAKDALKYRFCWSNAPVCAPARTALISGMFPTSTGSEHMRSMARLPAGIKFFPQYLRDAAYYCSNNEKEDYNLEKPGQVWDESSKQAHWRKRKPGQPFFAVFNILVSHESQLRDTRRPLVTDPAAVRVPAYMPDLPEVRRDWAKSYDNIALMDAEFGKRLAELDSSPEAEDTIVFFFGDHGSGMPRSKRSACDSGLRVPLLVRFPQKWRHLAPEDYQPGGDTGRMVQFVDFGPTVLSLAGMKGPEDIQGVAFAGRYRGAPNKYLHGFRGRMDERYDMVRSVTDGRYVYVRNYAPHRPAGQHVAYMFETPTTRVWYEAFQKGTLNAVQAAYWKPRETEELYDLHVDPDETVNLMQREELQSVVNRFRDELFKHTHEVRDVGFIPEDEMHRPAGEAARFGYGRSDRYSMARIIDAAERGTSRATPIQRHIARLSDRSEFVRYWAGVGLLVRGPVEAIDAGSRTRIAEALTKETSPSTAIVLAEYLGRYGDAAEREAAKSALWEIVRKPDQRYFAVVAALNALDYVKAGPPDEATAQALRKQAAKADPRTREYVGRLSESLARGR